MTQAEPIDSVDEVWTVPGQTASLTAFKATGVVVSSVLFLSLIARVLRVLVTEPSVPTFAFLVVPACLLGYLAADLLSGSAHWFCDTFFEEETPFLGKLLIRPFRDHHRYPQRITRYRFIEQDTTNFFLMLPLLGFAFLQGSPQPGSRGGLFWSCLLLTLAAGSFCTNLFHKWAHLRHRPAVVHWLQGGGFILGPERHHRHHQDYGRGFCVTSGWMNPLLDACRFFPRVEKLVRFFQR